jgi:hypothetical protein
LERPYTMVQYELLSARHSVCELVQQCRYAANLRCNNVCRLLTGYVQFALYVVAAANSVIPRAAGSIAIVHLMIQEISISGIMYVALLSI